MKKLNLIAKQMSELSASEATELLGIFEKEYNIVMPVTPPAIEEGVEIKIEDLEIQTSFDIVLEDPGQQRIKIVKLIKELTSLGLRESKQLVDDAPSTVLHNIHKDIVDDLKYKFTELGATITLR